MDPLTTHVMSQNTWYRLFQFIEIVSFIWTIYEKVCFITETYLVKILCCVAIKFSMDSQNYNLLSGLSSFSTCTRWILKGRNLFCFKIGSYCAHWVLGLTSNGTENSNLYLVCFNKCVTTSWSDIIVVNSSKTVLAFLKENSLAGKILLYNIAASFRLTFHLSHC